MASTARMILVVDPAEKTRWTAEARKAGISTAEYLRRAAAAFDPRLDPDEAELVRAAIAEITASATRMIAQLDETLASLDDLNDPEHEVRVRARIMAELEANPPRLDFSGFADRAAA